MNYFVNLWLKNVKKMKEEREEVRAIKKILRLKKVHVDLEQEPLDFLVYVIIKAKEENVINKDNEIELNRSLLLSYLEELGKEKKDKRFINWAIKEIRLLNDVELASLIGRKVVTEKEFLHTPHKKIRNILHFLQYPSIEDVLNDRKLYEELLDKLMKNGYMGILRKKEKKTIYKWKYTNGAFAYFCDEVAQASFSEKKKEIYPYFKRDIKDKNGRNFKNLSQAKQNYKKKKKESEKDENFKNILNDYLRKKKKKRIEKLLY